MRYLAWLALPFAGAVALGCVLPRWWLCIPLLLLFLWVGLLLRRVWVEGKMAATLAVVGICLGLAWSGLYTALWVQPTAGLHGQDVGFDATVVAYPQETDWGYTVLVRLEGGTVPGRKVELSLAGDWSHLRPGDQVTGEGRFSSAVAEGRSWSIGKGAFLTAYGELTQVYRPSEKLPWYYLPQYLGQKLKGTVDELLSPAAAALLRGLLTGDTSNLSEDVRSDFSRSGMAHLLAVSGLHIGFLAGLLTRQPGSRRWHAFVILPVLVLFALMIGGEPPVWRSVVMAGFIMFAPLARREVDQFTSLCAALLVLLLQNPYAIQSVSLQLSFASVAGLACFRERVYTFLMRFAARYPRLERPWRFLAHSLSVSLCATVLTMPLLAWHFGELSLVGPVANLFCLGLGTLCFGLGLIACLCAWCLPPLAHILGVFLELCLRLLMLAARFFAGGAYSSLPMDNVYYKVWLGAVCLLVVLMVLIKPLARRPILPLSAMTALLFLAMTLRMTSVGNVAFSVTALDVGQGSCTVFASRGCFVAVDCGGSDAGDALSDYVQGDGQIDLLVLTHYDSDHVDGLAQLLRRTEVACIALPDVADDSGNRSEIEGLAQRYGARLLWVDERTVVSFGEAEVRLYPPVSEGSDNAAGISVLASWQGWDALVTGDLPAAGERALMEREGLQDVEVLVAGHHGSSSSTCDALVAALRPEIALISVGENHYNLPSDQVLERLANYRCTIYRTDQNGSVTIRFREE